MDFGLISKYRSQLMGVAILFVVIFHSSIIHVNSFIDMICFIGDMGVDIFFLISGFGMYYAYIKRPSIFNFYLKRIIRIVPAWFVVNLIIQFNTVDMKHVNFEYLIKVMTGFLFWLEGNLYFWYISAILAFYLITPFFMNLYLKNKKKAYLAIMLLWMTLLGICFIMHNGKYFIFLFRWPVYFGGIYLGECSYKKIKYNRNTILASSIMLFVGLIFTNFIRNNYEHNNIVRYDYKYFTFILIVIPICILLPMLFEKVKYNFCILKFLGNITLEIYLLHEFLLQKITNWIDVIPFDRAYIIYNILVFGGVVLLAWMLHLILNCFIKKIVTI